MTFNRRNFLKASAATTAAAYLGLEAPALAKAPLASSQLPSAYRLKIGTIEVTCVSDGMLDLPLALYPKADKDGAEALLAKAHRAPAGVPTSINTYVLNTGDKLFLVDTGGGHIFGPDAAQLIPNLKAAGYDPDAIDAIILTHMHPDHIGGMVDNAGKPAFPKADLLINEKEYAFWTDEGITSRAPEDAKKYFRMAQAAAGAYKGRVQPFKAGDQIAPGIATVAAYGHTPGHTMVDIASGKDRLLIWVDIVHTAALQFPHPEWSISFDSSPEDAIETRKKVFDQVALDGTMVAGMHLDFPGLGYVSREAQGYAFQPAFRSPKI